MRPALALVGLVLGIAGFSSSAHGAERTPGSGPRETMFGDSIADSLSFVPEARALLVDGVDMRWELAPCRKLVRDGRRGDPDPGHVLARLLVPGPKTEALAETALGRLQQQLADLEAQFKQESEDAGAVVDSAEALETVAVKPKKADITVRLVALAWAPYWQDESGNLGPAY